MLEVFVRFFVDPFVLGAVNLWLKFCFDSLWFGKVILIPSFASSHVLPRGQGEPHGGHIGGNRRARQHNRALPARHVQDQAPGRAPDAPGHAQVQVRRTNPLPSPLFLPWHISCSEITSMLQCLLDITLQVIEGKNFLSTLMRLYHLEQPCRSVHESLICSLNKMLSNCRNK